jgi:hypothetical protein
MDRFVSPERLAHGHPPAAARDEAGVDLLEAAATGSLNRGGRRTGALGHQ